MVEIAIAEVKAKKKPTAISKIRFESFSEGKCAQIMNIAKKTARIQTLEELLQGEGYQIVASHIYPPLIVTMGTITQHFLDESRMNIAICTTAQSDEEARELLSLMGAPFAKA